MNAQRSAAAVGWAIAGAIVAVALFVILVRGPEDPDADRGQVFALGNTGGTVQVEKTPSGWRLDLAAPKLPRVDGDQHYAAYLKGPKGRISVGTFNDGDEVVLWAGVSPHDYPQLVVLIEPGGEEVTSATLELNSE